MEKNTVMIDLERYNELVIAESKLKTIKIIAENDKREYGYGTDTSTFIDAVLEIERA